MTVRADSSAEAAGGQPLVSVVMPTHNRAELLKRAAGSVLAQTHRNLELIVVDDASSDATPAVLAAIDDPRLVHVRFDSNQGASAARNAGIARARGTFIAFLDDDDFWLVQKLEKQVAALQASDKPWCICGFIRRDTGYSYVGGDHYIRSMDYAFGIGEEGHDWSLIATPGWLVRRDVLTSVGGFDPDVRSWDDWELGIRLTKAGGYVVVDEPLWFQDARLGGGLIRAERARARDLRIVLAKHGDLWQGSRKVQSRHWYLIGRIESLHDPAPAGRAELRRALRLSPLNLRALGALCASYLPGRWNRRLLGRMRKIRRGLA